MRQPRLTQLFSDQRLHSQIFCSGFCAAKKGLFGAEQRAWLVLELQARDAEVLYPMAPDQMAPDQTVLNYMVMKSVLLNYNFALQLSSDQRTGCCITSAGSPTCSPNQAKALHQLKARFSMF